MRIKTIEVYEWKIPLRTAFKTALRVVDAVDDIVVVITTDDGLTGYGEAPPTAVITGETRASIACAIREHIAPKLIGRLVLEMEENQRLLHSAMIGNTSAKAAVDIALYDLWAKRLNLPLYKALGGSKKRIDTDLTISVNPIEEMVKDSKEALRRGYTTLKIKVGSDKKKDIERIRRIREAVSSEVKLRLDANQGWTPKEALDVIEELSKYRLDIELIEQPVHYSDLEGMVEVTKHSPIPIMADESVFSPKQAIEVITRKAADIINIKLMKTGGIHKALQIISIADIYGVDCMIGCMLEGKVSVSAAAHLAAAREEIRYIDLDGPGLCKIDLTKGGPDFNEALITMNETAGIGIEEVRGLEEFFR